LLTKNDIKLKFVNIKCQNNHNLKKKTTIARPQ